MRSTTSIRALAIGSLAHPCAVDGLKIQGIKESIIKSYRRAWRFPFWQRGTRYLAIALVPDDDPTAEVFGMTFDIDQTGVDYLLERERGYLSVLVEAFDRYGNRDLCLSFARTEMADGLVPLSYLLTAAQGFRLRLGHNAAARFLETTDFDGQIVHDDLDDPVYLRTPMGVAEDRDWVLDYLRTFTTVELVSEPPAVLQRDLPTQLCYMEA